MFLPQADPTIAIAQIFAATDPDPYSAVIQSVVLAQMERAEKGDTKAAQFILGWVERCRQRKSAEAFEAQAESNSVAAFIQPARSEEPVPGSVEPAIKQPVPSTELPIGPAPRWRAKLSGSPGTPVPVALYRHPFAKSEWPDKRLVNCYNTARREQTPSHFGSRQKRGKGDSSYLENLDSLMDSSGQLLTGLPLQFAQPCLRRICRARPGHFGRRKR